jgi:hypothetical protein
MRTKLGLPNAKQTANQFALGLPNANQTADWFALGLPNAKQTAATPAPTKRNTLAPTVI